MAIFTKQALVRWPAGPSTLVTLLGLGVLAVILFLACPRQGRTRGDGNAAEAAFSYWIRGERFLYPAVPPSARLSSIDWNVMANIHEELLVLLSAWSSAAAAVGLPWWLGAGSVLGWVRNQSLIPWDDDIDIHVSVNDLHLIQERIVPHLRREFDDFVLIWCFGWCLKLTRRSSPLVYLDFFVKVRDAGLWRTAEIKMQDGKLAPIWGKYYVADNVTDEMLFPLQAVSLHGVPAFLPKDPEAVAKLNYGEDAIYSPQVFAAHTDGDLLARQDCVVVLA
jgi:hypothetical protein